MKLGAYILICRIGWGLALAASLAPALAQTPAAELPPKPTRYVTDTAGLLDPGAAAQINAQLEQFERATSNQFLVYIAPKLPENAEVAPFATDAFESWGVGQKGRDNGAVLFVFSEPRKIWISTGRGINGALTDAVAATIIRREITPRFKAGDYTGGVQAGVSAMLAAARGEYQGTGETVDERKRADAGGSNWSLLAIIAVIVLLSFFSRGRRGGGGGLGGWAGPVIFTGGGFGGGGGGGWSEGGRGGGFSGGGGGTDGGGAGGSW